MTSKKRRETDIYKLITSKKFNFNVYIDIFLN